MQQDFASRVGQEDVRASVSRRSRALSPSFRPNRKLLLGAAGFAGVPILLAMLLSGSRVDASVPITKEEWLPVKVLASEQQQRALKVVLKPGDAAVSALGKLGFPFVEVMQMAKAAKGTYSLKQVRAGQSFSRRDEAQMTHVYYDIDAKQRLHLYTSEAEAWQAEVQPRVFSSRQVRASGVVQDSLFSAAVEAGVDERTTMNLVDIFSWDVDFARDLRSGDRFSVLYEEQFDADGRLLGNVILAAEFVNQGESYTAVRYELADGNVEYFTAEGRSMRKTYLKSPVKFSRISSRFSSSREHPVLGYTRAHRGVDYAASSGTPIRAIGDGTVVYSAWKGGYGRFVEVRHTNSAHTTSYAHLQSYGRGIKSGTRIKQGQIIGYVGMSGLATGPHLHFEFRVRGQAVNPLALKHATVRPVPEKELAEFKETTQPLLNRLSTPMVALVWG